MSEIILDSDIKREKLSIYLAKDHAALDSDLIEIERTKGHSIAIEAVECDVTMYAKKSVPQVYPKWSNFLLTTNLVSLEGILDKSTSTGAVLIVRAYSKTFIITFGTTFHIVKSEMIERDFGLKVTLNSVDPKKLRSLDKANYNFNPLNSRNQSTTDVDIFDLSIDSETDLVYAVTGSSSVEIFGPQVTGRDALVISPYVSLNTLHKILHAALEQYSKPLPAEFEWIENINRVRDEDTIEILDLELDKYLDAKSSDAVIWLGEPEVVDWENHVGYSFDLYPKTERHIVLKLIDLQNYLKVKGVTFNCGTAKAQYVHINDNEFRSTKAWSAYRCLYAEIKYDKQQYMLRNGTWFKINDNFIQQINLYLDKIEMYSVTLPEYNHMREELYNKETCDADSSYDLMDKKNLKFGGSYSKIEFCDIIKDKTDFIHVKYYRSSNTLSHLFAQGLVSAETFVSDSEFRKKLNNKLPSHLKFSNPDVRPDSSKYCIVYAIATEKTKIDELPFFSKVTLKNVVKKLGGLGFRVKVSFITVNPKILMMKKGKAAIAKGAKLKKA